MPITEETTTYAFGNKHTLYECGICGECHHWQFNGDCRDDANRHADEQEYAERNNISASDVTVVSWDERVAADYGDDHDSLLT
jgi:hypothetical protein